MCLYTTAYYLLFIYSFQHPVLRHSYTHMLLR